MSILGDVLPIVLVVALIAGGILAWIAEKPVAGLLVAAVIAACD